MAWKCLDVFSFKKSIIIVPIIQNNRLILGIVMQLGVKAGLGQSRLMMLTCAAVLSHGLLRSISSISNYSSSSRSEKSASTDIFCRREYSSERKEVFQRSPLRKIIHQPVGNSVCVVGVSVLLLLSKSKPRRRRRPGITTSRNRRGRKEYRGEPTMAFSVEEDDEKKKKCPSGLVRYFGIISELFNT